MPSAMSNPKTRACRQQHHRHWRISIVDAVRVAESEVRKEHFAVEVIYSDSDVVELRSHLDYQGWSGSADAYTTRADIREFVSDLRQFSDGKRDEASFRAGAGQGSGQIALRFYRYDAAGHVACQVRMATPTASDQRPEEVFSMELEAKTEVCLIDRFVPELEKLADTQSGRAGLALIYHA